MLPSQDGDQAGAGGATDIRLLLYVAVVTTLSATLHILLRPDLVYGEQFLAFDQGNHLFLGHALRDGLTLYRDVAYPYGAASAYVLAGVDLVFRLSATTYIWTLTALNTAFVVLAAHVIRLHSTRAITAAVVLGGLVPMALTPGSIVGSYTTNSYIPLERLILIALTLTWSDPAARSRRRSMLAGAIVGAWQFVKFGGGVFGLAAWLAVDALALARVRARPVKWRIVLAGWGTLAGTAALVEALRWAVLFRWLPSSVAFDVAWPHYTAQLYTSVPYDVRWPTPDAMVLLTQYSLPTLALVLSCRALWAAPERRTHTAALALFLPGIFFVAGTLGYFGHIHTMRQVHVVRRSGSGAVAALHGPHHPSRRLHRRVCSAGADAEDYAREHASRWFGACRTAKRGPSLAHNLPARRSATGARPRVTHPTGFGEVGDDCPSSRRGLLLLRRGETANASPVAHPPLRQAL